MFAGEVMTVSTLSSDISGQVMIEFCSSYGAILCEKDRHGSL